MKNAKWRMPFICLLCTAICCALFLGCTDSQGSQSDTTTQKPAETKAVDATQSPDDSDELAYLNKTGYPIVNSPVTLSLMVRYSQSRGCEPSKNYIWQYIAEETGLTFEFTAIENAAWTEKKNLALAGGDLPDIIYNGLGYDDLMNQAKTGNFIDYSGYLADYAPNISMLMEQNQSIKNAMVMPDGSVRSMVWTNMEIEKGQGKCPPDYIGVNEKFLDALGLTMPQTTQEFYDMCIAFRNDDPNGNGLKDEIPIAPNTWASLDLMSAFFGVMFGDYDCFVTDEGVIEYVPFTEEYKLFLEFMIDLYENELIDPEIFTMDSAAVKAKGNGEVDIYGVTIRSAPFAIVGQEKGNDFGIAPPFEAPNGDRIWINRTYANAGVWAITKECQTVEAAVRLGDMFYDENYVNMVWMGVDGESYEFSEDGTTWDWIYTDELGTPEEVRAVMTLQTSNQGPSMCPPEWFNINDPVEGPVNEQRVWMAENYGDCLREALPKMYYEADVAKEIADIYANLQPFYEENYANFVMGKKDISELDDVLAQLRSMDADRLVELVQQTYDANYK